MVTLYANTNLLETCMYEFGTIMRGIKGKSPKSIHNIYLSRLYCMTQELSFSTSKVMFPWIKNTVFVSWGCGKEDIKEKEYHCLVTSNIF